TGNLAIEHLERLRRVRARLATSAARLQVGLIEDFHERELQVSLGDQINAAAVMLAFIGSYLPLCRIVEQVDQLFFHRRNNALAAEGRVQPAGNRKHAVADLLGGQAAAWEVPEEAVVG